MIRPRDVHDVPFSKAGSFLKITSRTATESGRLMIGTSKRIPLSSHPGKGWPQDFYEVALTSATREPRETRYDVEATAWSLTLKASRGEAVFAFQDNQTLAFSARGVGVRLLPCRATSTAFRPRKDLFCREDYQALCTHMVRPARGTSFQARETTTVFGETGPFKDVPIQLDFSGPERCAGAIRFTRYCEDWNDRLPSMTGVLKERRQEWEAWLGKLPDVPDELGETAEAAWYTMWLCLVDPDGLITRRTILMSKQWMNQVWSWDNCFNALAVARADPELAFDQLRVFFDAQASTGAFPDSINSFACQYTFVKPPVWGWTIQQLGERVGPNRMQDFIREAYEPIARQTDWWYTHRDFDQDGMCQYHHGNDSGWDNATVFDQGCPTEGADLAAHLVLQQEALAEMAFRLDRREEGQTWRRRAREQLRNLLDQGVRGNRFISPLNGRSTAKDTGCLLNRMPLILGKRLPAPILSQLIKDLSPVGRFLTDHGPATQAIDSALYTPNGYWRGPIWAPSTVLLFDGLVQSGETSLAELIAGRFCAMCSRDAKFWENYDALTGRGLCCPGYSWTAAGFLFLAEWLAGRSPRRSG